MTSTVSGAVTIVRMLKHSSPSCGKQQGDIALRRGNRKETLVAPCIDAFPVQGRDIRLRLVACDDPVDIDDRRLFSLGIWSLVPKLVANIATRPSRRAGVHQTRQTSCGTMGVGD